eukprot:2144995-Amphidinium_carterae.1
MIAFPSTSAAVDSHALYMYSSVSRQLVSAVHHVAIGVKWSGNPTYTVCAPQETSLRDLRIC